MLRGGEVTKRLGINAQTLSFEPRKQQYPQINLLFGALIFGSLLLENIHFFPDLPLSPERYLAT
jgi:hypothetical protein